MATAKRLIKKAPTIIQRAYYSIVPFGKRYGKEYVNWRKYLKTNLNLTPEQLKQHQFYKELWLMLTIMYLTTMS
jgi:hypothetical protein